MKILCRLLKDVTIESSSSIDLNAFIPLLQKYITRRKPHIRQLMMSWIEVLNSLADIHMLDYLPSFLKGLFFILSDPNRGTFTFPLLHSLPFSSSFHISFYFIEIRHAAENLLNDFLHEIRDTEVIDLLPIVNIVVQQCSSRDVPIRLTAIKWLDALRKQFFFSFIFLF